jgi:hypothetical protein
LRTDCFIFLWFSCAACLLQATEMVVVVKVEEIELVLNAIVYRS